MQVILPTGAGAVSTVGAAGDAERPQASAGPGADKALLEKDEAEMAETASVSSLPISFSSSLFFSPFG